MSNVRQEKCPTNAIKMFRKHETINLIRLKQTAKTNKLDDEHNERTEETIKKAEKDFALDLPMLVEETARDTKILNAITAVEKNQRRFFTLIGHTDITLQPDLAYFSITTRSLYLKQ